MPLTNKSSISGTLNPKAPPANEVLFKRIFESKLALWPLNLKLFEPDFVIGFI